MDWRVGVLILGAGLFGLLVVAIFAGAARVSRYEDMEIKDELQPLPVGEYYFYRPPPALPPLPEDSTTPIELVLDPGEKTSPMWITTYESERAQQP